MKYLAISALLAATAGAFFTSPPPGHRDYKIGTDLVLNWEITNPPAATFVLTLRAENQTAYGYVPGPFGGTIGLYDFRDVVLEDALPLTNGTYTWKVEPSGGDATFIGEEVLYWIRADWNVTGSPWGSGDSIDYFRLVN
ncbi:hypothetical protein F4680DRAFT_391642 [Xylaria scruposa]|nr:hypothetical protein F4680DRAFT_391642 [Xylaria scruposa]